MTFLLAIAGISAVLLTAGWLDRRLNTDCPTYHRVMTALLGPAEDDEQQVPEPRSHVRTHCPFCGHTPPYHHPGCSPLDRLDTPRPRETRT